MGKVSITIGFAFWLLIQTCSNTPEPKPNEFKGQTITASPQ
jgi:hypothetical protein